VDEWMGWGDGRMGIRGAVLVSCVLVVGSRKDIPILLFLRTLLCLCLSAVVCFDPMLSSMSYSPISRAKIRCSLFVSCRSSTGVPLFHKSFIIWSLSVSYACGRNDEVFFTFIL